MSKFEIINPSDETYIEGNFEECAIATVFLGNGKYGLKEVNGTLEMPLLFLGGAEEWFKKTFDKTMEQCVIDNKSRLKEVFASVKSVTHSSLNEIERYAHEVSKSI